MTRIFVGTLLGCVIGWEREARGSAAGDRTFGLVSLGGRWRRHDLSRRDTMRGLTSPAALWAAAAIGMLAGIEELLIALLITVLILLILEARYLPGLRRLGAHSWRPTEGKGGEE